MVAQEVKSSFRAETGKEFRQQTDNGRRQRHSAWQTDVSILFNEIREIPCTVIKLLRFDAHAPEITVRESLPCNDTLTAAPKW